MSGFVQPQWSGFSPAAEPQTGTSDADRQPMGHEIERDTLGRAAPPAMPAPADSLPLPPAPGHADAPSPVTSASPQAAKALTP
jgi:hypothetical protein